MKSLDIKLSEHFSLREFVRSSSAQRLDIDNKPDAEAIENLRNLCTKVLEPLREHLGQPVVITSGFRSKRLNEVVGGVKNSQHLTGEAADLKVEGEKQAREWIRWMMDNLEFDQLILEKKDKKVWVHVSLKRNRMQVKSLTSISSEK